MQAVRGENQGPDLGLVAQLAAAVARPLDVLDERAGRLDPLTATETRAISAHPDFRGPVNRAVANLLRLPEIAVGPAELKRLAADPAFRVAVLLVSQPNDVIRQAAVIVAAAILHKRVLMVTLRVARERIRAVLGNDGYEIAVREAPLLHAALAELDTSADQDIFDPAVAPEAARASAIDLGRRALCGFVDHVAPAFSELMSHRCQSELDRQARGHDASRLAAGHCDHIVRLVRRRVRPWSAIIG